MFFLQGNRPKSHGVQFHLPLLGVCSRLPERIDGLQPIPRDSNDKGLVAMLDDRNKVSHGEDTLSLSASSSVNE